MADSLKVKKLKELSFFIEVSENDLREIAAITTERRFDVGEVIIEENSKAETFFIIHRGKIEILKKFEDGEEVILGVYSDGEFFGEMAILDEGPRSATARAIEPTTVLQVSYKDFERVLAFAPQIAFSIMKELSVRLRQTGALLVWELTRKNRELTESSLKTIRAVVTGFERQNKYYRGHSERVAALAADIGRNLGMEEEDIDGLELGGLLHDLGMVGVNSAVLAKAGPLENDELEMIRRHPMEGKAMIEDVSHLQRVATSVLYHHERYDGSGYPEGLSGKAIPPAARILAVAEVFDALTNDRPYRKKMRKQEALSYLSDQAGRGFDPEVVKVLLELQP